MSADRQTSTDLVELPEPPRDPALHNPSLDPTRLSERTWGRWDLAALWVGMSVCIPTYMLAGDLIRSGMSWWQAMLAVLLGNLLVLLPMILNGHAGTRYGIPFPVFARAAFGTAGAHIPSLARALVACGWFGIQTYIGGEAISAMVALLWPGWLALGGGVEIIGMTLPSWISFIAFWLINVYFVWRGTESIKWMEKAAAPFLLLVGVALLYWAVDRGGGLLSILARSSELLEAQEGPGGFEWVVSVFLPGLTAMVGFWATLSLNIPDFTRYGRSQREQVLGQFLGLPPTMVLFSFIGVVVTAATKILYGEAIWDPVALVVKIAGESDSIALAFLAMLTLAVATLSTNIAANIVGPANSFANAFPRLLSFRGGGMAAALLGVLLCPWLLLGVYIDFLVSYSGLLGAVGGVLIADYWILRRTELDLAGLYKSDGPYRYQGGFNLRAIAAMVVGLAVVGLGYVVPSLAFLASGAWFSGVAASGVAYYLLMRGQLAAAR
ncbi:MAG: NCS1 family nucleobase:cation symporter-1 [Myxococcales bacterium]|nr:NCS1 family nucleobase:cation symporter-1 [Myxococcales bacterium]